MSSISRVDQSLARSAQTLQSVRALAPAIAAAGEAIVAALKAGGTVFTVGNGGSAAEALHMAEELSGRFLANRRALPGMALVADPTALTCIGNDYGFDHIFSRQLEAFGKPGDVLVLFSTSGNAENLRLALAEARRKQLKTVALLGRGGGRIAGQSDWEIVVPGEETARIQEAHQVILHIFLEFVELEFVQGS